MKRTGSNVNTIKIDNSSLILNCIRRHPISRIDIAKQTGLSKSAVTTIVKELLDQGQITEIGTESTEQGRHPILLDIVADYRYAMGISLHRETVCVCIVDLKFRHVASERRPTDSFATPEEAVDWAYETGLRLMDDNGIAHDRCIGIGIASPGPLDDKRGLIMIPPNFSLFHHFNVKEHLAKKCNYPVFLNNAPVLKALYENQMREDVPRKYALVSIDTGIGSAIIQDGNVYRGAYGLAGEIGHTTVDIDGDPCTCGQRGCLECYITKKAIVRRFSPESFEAAIDAAYRGDRAALDMIEYIARYFAAGVVNLINLLDLEAVMLFGELNVRPDLLIARIQEYVNQHSIIAKVHPVTVFPSLIEPGDIEVYTAAQVLKRYFEQAL